MRYLRATLLALLLVAAPAAAQQPGDHLTVYLLTMGTGDQVWEKYGHNAIWIQDAAAGSDWVYNYGVFDFDSPGYWGRFVRGDWLYQLAVSDIVQTLAQYRYLNRTVVAQELALSGPQKLELQRFLEWNYLPENREYLYDYFLDNCSTRIRDAIDRVLGGTIREATGAVPTETTFRWHSRRLMAGSPVVYTALNAGLGPAADRPITAWEEMFLPEKLQERVREVSVAGEGGAPRPLVAGERVLHEAVGRAPDRQAPPQWIPIYLAIGVLLAALLAGLGWAAARSRAAGAAFVLLGTGWMLLVGIGGLLLVALWALTNHTVAHRNENLFQFAPLALALVVLLPAGVLGARWASRPARIVGLLVGGLAVLGMLVQVFPGFDQVNGEIIALMLPPNLAVAWVLARLDERRRGTAPVRAASAAD